MVDFEQGLRYNIYRRNVHFRNVPHGTKFTGCYILGDFYDGAKLLSLTDITGSKPEIYMCTTNRSGGKTTWFNRYCLKRFINYGEKFMLLYRYNYELDDCANKFFKDISGLFFPGHEMTDQRRAKGIFYELFLDGVNCGYAVSINSADQIKKYSHFFSDTVRMLMDEFQSETNHYCADEVKKFRSVHTSVARGQGAQSRYVPVYMLSNPVTLLNPYYVAMNISSRLTDNVKFLRGEGWVLEQGYVDAASKAQASSAFNRAFSGDTYDTYLTQAVYLNDSSAFIEKPEGNSRYLGTLRYMAKEYGLRESADSGVIYCDDRPDTSYKFKLAVTTDDHRVNYVMLKSYAMFLDNMRYYFDRGAFRFKNLMCKEVILKALSY